MSDNTDSKPAASDSELAETNGEEQQESWGKILAFASWTVFSRIVGWAAIGMLLGSSVFGFLHWIGYLKTPESWGHWIWALLPVYIIVGGGIMGYVGFFRGLGRVTIYTLLSKGYASKLVGGILDKTMQLVRKTQTGDSSLNKGEEVLDNLPLARYEAALKEAVGINEQENPDATWVGRVMRRFLNRQIEKVLLKQVRSECNESGGGGVSMEKARALALETLDKSLTDLVLSLMQNQTLIGLAVLALLYAIAPVALH